MRFEIGDPKSGDIIGHWQYRMQAKYGFLDMHDDDDDVIGVLFAQGPNVAKEQGHFGCASQLETANTVLSVLPRESALQLLVIMQSSLLNEFKNDILWI